MGTLSLTAVQRVEAGAIRLSRVHHICAGYGLDVQSLSGRARRGCYRRWREKFNWMSREGIRASPLN